MLRRVFDWFIQLFRREKLYKYEFADDIPDKISSCTVYLIGNQGYYWQAVMICPCGCRKLLHMNLMDDYDPYWKYKLKGNVISLVPSVNRLVGCKSHFFVTNGKIEWC